MKTIFKKNGGFTLVELIVVIAILAILSAVAVPAYSGYIAKANKQADITLVKDIEKALTLAYYNQDLPEGTAGYVVLSPKQGESMDDGNGVTALAIEKVFGSGDVSTMQLKYGDWDVKNTMISHADATNVVNSNFVQKYTTEELMGEVQSLTDAVVELSKAFNGDDADLRNLYSYNADDGTQKNFIDDTLAEYGIKKEWSELSATEQSNVLVLATANSVNSGKNSVASAVLPVYASYAAFAAENEEFNVAYEAFKKEIETTDPAYAEKPIMQYVDAYKRLGAVAKSEGFETWQNTNNNGTVNGDAFNTIMAGVSNAMKDNGNDVLANLDDSNMFTSGVGSELYNNYLDSVYAAAGSAGTDVGGSFGGSDLVMDGYVTVWYSINNGILYIDNSLPVNE